jgi:hypothetical protein
MAVVEQTKTEAASTEVKQEGVLETLTVDIALAEQEYGVFEDAHSANLRTIAAEVAYVVCILLVIIFSKYCQNIVFYSQMEEASKIITITKKKCKDLTSEMSILHSKILDMTACNGKRKMMCCVTIVYFLTREDNCF